MTETITINGKDYKPEPVLATSDDCIKLDGQLYALKPINKPEKQEYLLAFWPIAGNYLLDRSYIFTEPQAQALSDAIKALVEYVQGSPPEPYADLPLSRAANKARELISSEEQSE